MKILEKVSIIIPCYNVEKYIKDCLDSIINQTYKNIEIICVNDGSTDATKDIIKSYHDKRIIYIEQENSGVSKARNIGLVAANGKYITFVDGDDLIKKDMIEILVEKMQRYKCDIVFCSYIKKNGNTLVETKIYGEKDIFIDDDDFKKFYCRFIGLTKEQLKNPELADSLCTVWGKLYRSELIKNYKFVDLKKVGTFEDGYFNINVLLNMKNAYYISSGMYYYRKENSSSITSVYKENLFLQWNTLFNYIYRFLVENRLDDKCFIEAYNNRICMSILGLGLNELNNPNGFIQKYIIIRKILSSERYRKACDGLELRYFSLKWRIFYLCSKYKITIGVYILLLCIRKAIDNQYEDN